MFEPYLPYSVSFIVTRHVEVVVRASSPAEAERLAQEQLEMGEEGLVRWQKFEIEDCRAIESHKSDEALPDGSGYPY